MVRQVERRAMSDGRTATPPMKWIWPFELIERIGEGGMGVVYRARYVVNGREVAVKMLPADVSDKIVLARFEREMEVLKNLRHINIVRCFGGACEDKQRFYAMELIPGGSLEDVLQSRGKLSWEQVVEYGRQMCAALACSHAAGVVHRDVKPSNFLIAADGSLKLSDFGLATVVAARRITAAGKTAGTLLYMSPEQIRGGDITPASDLYALGCVFYELLTGRPPFVGDSPAATLHMHCKQEIPRASQIALDCPPAFDDLIRRMMAKAPADRPASAEAVSEELGQIASSMMMVQTRRSLNGGSRLSQRPTGSDPERPRLESARTPAAPLSAPSRSGEASAPRWLPIALGTALAFSVLANVVLRRADSRADAWAATWETLSTNENLIVRQSALNALAATEGNDHERAEVFRKRLADEDPTIRLAAVQGLGKLGSSGKIALVELMRLQKEDNAAAVRETAIQVVGAIKEAPSRGSWAWPLTVLCLLAAGGTGVYWWMKQEQAA